MLDLLKIILILAFIVFLLRKKVQVGYVLLLGAALMVGLYLMPPRVVVAGVWRALTGSTAIKLAVALTTIRGFEMILREKEIMREMMAASGGLLRNRKAIIVSMPLLIGMLPSVGGAYFSAPMVEESSKGLRLSDEEKGFINYWFRHPWEYVLPLYPGIVLASAITGLELRGLIAANLPYALMIAITGFLFGLRWKGEKNGQKGRKKVSKRGPLSFIPIAGVIALVVFSGIELHWALLVAFGGLIAFYRYKPKEIVRLVGHALKPDVLVLIAGVMVFKEIMEGSGAVCNLSAWFASMGMPLMPLLFLLPFAGGLLTGLTIGFVGSTFPLILSLEGGGTLPAISFAFASGFLGVLASPVHVCLILTREYFKADMWGMYRRMIPAGIAVFAVAMAEYLVLR
jgi:hypothetical protein